MHLDTAFGHVRTRGSQTIVHETLRLRPNTAGHGCKATRVDISVTATPFRVPDTGRRSSWVAGSENSSHCPCPGARRPGRRDRRGSGCSAPSGTRTGLAGRTDRLTSPAVGGSKSISQQAFSIAERADRRSISAISSWLPARPAPPPSAARAPATMAASSVIAVCTAVNSVEGSITLLSRLDLGAGGE